MRRSLIAVALGIAGVLFALGMTVGASVLVARDLGDPVRVVQVPQPRDASSHSPVERSPSPTPGAHDGGGSEDRSGDRSGPGGGDDHSGGTEGPGDSSGSGSGGSDDPSGSGSGSDDSSGSGSGGSDDSSGAGSGDEAHDD